MSYKCIFQVKVLTVYRYIMRGSRGADFMNALSKLQEELQFSLRFERCSFEELSEMGVDNFTTFYKLFYTKGFDHECQNQRPNRFVSTNLMGLLLSLKFPLAEKDFCTNIPADSYNEELVDKFMSQFYYGTKAVNVSSSIST